MCVNQGGVNHNHCTDLYLYCCPLLTNLKLCQSDL